MNRRGVTLIELLLVITLIGIMGAFALPRIGDGITRQNVNSARTLFIGTHAKARAVAIQRGSQTSLIVNNGSLTIQSVNPVTGAVQQVGNVENLVARYGVKVEPPNVTMVFDGRGMGMETTWTIIIITKGAYGSQVRISPVGRVWQ